MLRTKYSGSVCLEDGGMQEIHHFADVAGQGWEFQVGKVRNG